MAGKIFINYRRGDDQGFTGRLFDRLQDAFEPEQLFLDVDNIPPGVDFVQMLDERVAESDVVLAVIGKNWIDARDANGSRRLDDPDDFVRIELASALSQGKRVIPVLVGEAQMPRPEDLPDALRPLARRNAVRLTHERFRSDVQGLVKALQQGFNDIEARREAEVRQRAQAEAQHKERQAEAAPGSVEQKSSAPAETERNAGTRRRGRQPRAGMLIVAACALIVLGGSAAYWLATTRLPSAERSIPAANVPALPAKQTAASPGPDQTAWNLIKQTTDAAALERFIAEYPASPLRQQAEARLAAIETARPAKPKPTPRADELAWQMLKATADETALKQFTAQYPDSPLRKDAEARIAALEAARAARPSPPRPDEVAWNVLKDTTAADALKRFIAQYPNSALRKEAEARIAELQAAQAAQPASPSPEEIAWNLVKDSTDADELRRFLAQFPAGKMRPQAEQRLAALTGAQAKAAALDNRALALSLQSELKRVGCFDGPMSGDFDDATRAAQRTFAKLTSLSLPDALTPAAIDAVRKFDKRVCPLVCGEGKRAQGDRCVAVAPTRKSEPRNKETKAKEPRNRVKKAAARRPGGKCFSYGGRSYCE
jgi:hypothetical protein